MKDDKTTIDLRVMGVTGYDDPKIVRDITRSFLEEIMVKVALTGEVRFPGFGTFRLVERKGKRSTKLMRGKVRSEQEYGQQLMVSFKKAAHFRRLVKSLKGEGMDKFAVDEQVDQEDLEKKASEGCPECGREPEKHGSTLICPIHGSEPFESKRK